MSFTLPSHITQKDHDWYLDTINGKYIHERWIQWYCDKYWRSQGISPNTGKPIRNIVKKRKARRI